MIKEKGVLARYSDKTLIKTAFISVIVYLIFVFVNFSLSTTLNLLFSNNAVFIKIYGVLSSLFSFILESLIFLGFYAIGRRYNSKFLRVVSILGIILLGLYAIGGIFTASMFERDLSLFNQTITDKMVELGITDISSSLSTEQTKELGTFVLQSALTIFKTEILLFVLFILSIIIYTILFGIGLIKVKKHVPLANLAGILEIIGGATLILFGLGFLFMIIATILEIVILYRESNK